ncbi:MAG TPA: VIT domain-containing protein, partial [Pyrinomonadaceae bacterium]|nr:VIT domain-containing protein [Pyrinomonadaceae bacterium]
MQRIVIISLLVLVIVSFAFARQTPEGSLEASSKSGTELGTCPLKHTKVRTDISGFLARVTVEQEFENSFNEAIEAVYVFPLSASGAVDSMKMTIGQRTIRGVMMKREDARKAYEAAKKDGKTASLLDQERPNVFTQSVANIQPGDRIDVEISYVETLKYDSGAYE